MIVVEGVGFCEYQFQGWQVVGQFGKWEIDCWWQCIGKWGCGVFFKCNVGVYEICVLFGVCYELVCYGVWIEQQVWFVDGECQCLFVLYFYCVILDQVQLIVGCIVVKGVDVIQWFLLKGVGVDGEVCEQGLEVIDYGKYDVLRNRDLMQ